MKVVDKINNAENEGRPFWSFEYFPPKTQQGLQNLYDRMERMKIYNPEFIDVTWGAGGSSADLTIDIVTKAQQSFGLETMMHLTCTNMPKQQIDDALKAAKACGCQNILALRGDPPHGQEKWESCDGGFQYAADLVRYIREQYGDYFCIAVAGHPEGHIDNPDKNDDLLRLKEKIDAGADLVVTQLFFDVNAFIDFYSKARAIGITVPILPGIFPIQNYNGLKRVISFNDNHVPQKIWDDLEAIQEDDNAVKEYGINLAIEFIKKIREIGINGFHIYTFNLERSSRILLERLGLVESTEKKAVSVVGQCAKETINPIFSQNYSKEFIQVSETLVSISNASAN